MSQVGQQCLVGWLDIILKGHYMDFWLWSAGVKDRDFILDIKQEHICIYGYRNAFSWEYHLTNWNINHSNIGFFQIITLGFMNVGFVRLNTHNWEFPFYEIYLPPHYINEDVYSSIIRLLYEDIIAGKTIVRIGCIKADDDAIFICEELGGKESVETDTHIVFEFYADPANDTSIVMSEFETMLWKEDKGKFCKFIPN